MIYKFTYWYNDRLLKHTCRTVKEADTFFQLLLAIKCQSVRIESIKIS